MAEIQCKRCGSKAPGLDRPPLPGEVGEKIAAGTCPACWQLWLGEQVIVINERGLSPGDPQHYDQLVQALKSYLKLTEGEG